MARAASKAAIVLLALAIAPTLAQGARLLVVPLASDSHIAAFTALTTELEALGGHEIHMVVSDALEAAAQSMAAARRPAHAHSYLTYPFRFELFADDMAAIAKANPIVAMRLGYKLLTAMIEMVIGDVALVERMRQLQPDLVIGDASAAYGHWLGAKLGVPSIEFDVGTSSGLLHAGQWGGQVNPAYYPASGTFYPTTGMTFPQRLVNAAATLATKAMVYMNRGWGPIGSLARRHNITHLPGQGPSRPQLLLVNFDWALEAPRPVAPSTKYVGALMPRPPARLPDNILRWLEDASSDPDIARSSGSDRGGSGRQQAQPLPVVYISFGASFLAPEAAMPALAAALASNRHAMRFLLRMREGEEVQLRAALAQQGIQLEPAGAAAGTAEGAAADWLLVLPQVPQNDLLGHPAVAAFVTQGGYLSMQEAAYHGVPVVGIPLMIGHTELVQHAADHGRGLVVPKQGLMAGDGSSLAQALLEVVTNSSYRAQAAVTAARLKAHPRSPGQRAADWVAYALAAAPEHGSFLHTQGQEMHWWQVVLLDVLAAYAAALALLGLLLQRGVRWCLRRWRGSRRQAAHRQPGSTAKGKSD